MEALTSALSNLAINTNYVLEVHPSYFKANVLRPTNEYAIRAHQKTVLKAMDKYVFPALINDVVNNHRRTTTTIESITEDLMKGDKPHTPIKRDHFYLTALATAADAFRPDSQVRPIHLLDVQHHYPHKWQTNAEAPFSTSPHFLNMLPPDTKPTTGNMKHIIFDFTRQWHHQIKDGTATFDEYLFFMLLHVKTTIVKADDPNKLRAIWGVPKPWIYAQIMFHWALFACYRRNPKRFPLLWGYETFTGGWFRLNAELFSSFMSKSFISIDWKSFDKDVPHEGIDDVSDNTAQYIDFDHGYMPTSDYPDTQSTWTHTKANRLRRLYAWTRYAYKNTPLVLPNGSLIRRRFATLPSGLYTTQYYDSHWNYIMISTILLRLGFDPKLCIIKVMGDDCIIRIYVCIPQSQHLEFLAAMQELATEYFGTTISTEKSSMTNTCNGTSVLSYVNFNGLPHRTEASLLAKLFYTSSSDPTPAITMASAIGIAYASCGFSKPVYNTCKDIYNYYSKQGFTPDSRGLTGVIYTDPHSQDKLDLASFPTKDRIQAHLTRTEYVNVDTYNRFYPRSHFLADF
jgi:hypothetical protein